MVAGIRPRRVSVNPNVASGTVTATSAHATSPEPPPSAGPFTWAITARGQASIVSNRFRAMAASATFSSCSRSRARRIHSMSAPAQNAVPAPVSTMTRVPS